MVLPQEALAPKAPQGLGLRFRSANSELWPGHPAAQAGCGQSLESGLRGLYISGLGILVWEPVWVQTEGQMDLVSRRLV